LLTRYGVYVGSLNSAAAKIAATNLQLMATPLGAIVRELRRTLAFAQQQRHEGAKPARVWLTGGGGSIAGLDRYLAVEAGLLCNAWQLRADDPSDVTRLFRTDARFAAAASLSALAWEAVDAY
jgi:hypothetical protein